MGLSACVWLARVAFLLSFSLGASAGSFKVFPLKLNLGPQTKTAVFKIKNTDTKPVTVQLESALWQQDEDGNDQYLSTQDVVFFPKIVKVAEGQERIVRIAYRGSPAGDREKSYRIFAQELPDKSRRSGALSFALRFSVPIFVSAQAPSIDPEIKSMTFQNGKLDLQIRNAGSSHFILKKMQVEGKNSNNSVFSFEKDGWYVLPGVQKTFSIEINESDCEKVDFLQISFKLGGQSYSRSLEPDTRECFHLNNVGLIDR